MTGRFKAGPNGTYVFEAEDLEELADLSLTSIMSELVRPASETASQATVHQPTARQPTTRHADREVVTERSSPAAGIRPGDPDINALLDEFSS